MMQKNSKKSAGFTLLEATIALAILLILSLSMMTVFYHTLNATTFLRERQHAFEQARGSLDLLLMNIQMARSIVLHTDNDGNLMTMTLSQREPNGELGSYDFHFIANEQIISIGQRNNSNTFARHIANITVIPDQEMNPRRLYITITTVCRCIPRYGHCECTPCACEIITLTGNADIRYKSFRRR